MDAYQPIDLVPELDENTGKYIVKIFGKDNSIDADDQIIYINAPIIDYTVGNEGAIAQAGTELRIIGKNLPYFVF